MLIKICPHCGKSFETDHGDKIYCNQNCSKSARAKRDESYYNFPRESTIPLFSFECAYCVKRVDIYSSLDRRHKYCCYKHFIRHREQIKKSARSKGRKGSNIGMSGGMSLGSLIRRENRDLD